MQRSLKHFAWTVGLTLLLPAVVLAQAGRETGVVSATGTKSVKEKPSEMRMVIRLSEKATTVKEAVSKLQERIEAATLQLEQLGVKKEGLEVTEPTTAGEGSEQELRMRQMMMMRRSARGGKTPKGLSPPKSVTVAATVTAKWPLGKRSGAELLEYCHTLQEKVTEADLAGLKEKKELSPEEEELLEEAQEMMGSYGNEENPAEPKFFFVGRISDEQRQKAMEEAFAKAKAQAEKLAAAAGAKLGKLSSLSQTGVPDFGEYEYTNQMQLLRRMNRRDADEDESISSSPDSIGVDVVVQASFELQ